MNGKFARCLESLFWTIQLFVQDVRVRHITRMVKRLVRSPQYGGQVGQSGQLNICHPFGGLDAHPTSTRPRQLKF